MSNSNKVLFFPSTLNATPRSLVRYHGTAEGLTVTAKSWYRKPAMALLQDVGEVPVEELARYQRQNGVLRWNFEGELAIKLAGALEGLDPFAATDAALNALSEKGSAIRAEVKEARAAYKAANPDLFPVAMPNIVHDEGPEPDGDEAYE